MRFPATPDRPVADSLRALPRAASGAPREMFARAEAHGVAGVIWDAWKATGTPIEPDLAMRLEARAIARELDHEAHLAMLHRIDELLTAPAIALKGPLFAERYYARPSSRGTSDIDLLVAEDDVDRTIDSLAQLGYVVFDSPEKVAWALREHHHVALTRAGAPDLELHFHAYQGFGVTLRTEALAADSVALPGFHTLRVPAPEDELVYLAVHAAAHRFGRLAWLHDLRLLVEAMSPEAVEAAATRARARGLARPLSLAGELLVDVLGVDARHVAPLGRLPRGRRAAVHAVVVEPRARVLGAMTRFAYTTMLADSMSGSLRYARRASLGHARRLLGLEPWRS